MSESGKIQEDGEEEISPIYLSYEEAPGGEGLFVYLPDAQVAGGAAGKKAPKADHCTRIRKAGKRTGHPTIDILCFSAEKISTERAQEIGQAAVRWLRKERRMA